MNINLLEGSTQTVLNTRDDRNEKDIIVFKRRVKNGGLLARLSWKCFMDVKKPERGMQNGY